MKVNMSRLTEITAVVLPFALLRAEGPKRLPELFLKPKIFMVVVLFNIALWGAYKGYLYFLKNAPWPMVLVHAMNSDVGVGLKRYGNTDFVRNQERSGLPFGQKPNQVLELEWQAKVDGPVFGELLETDGRIFVSNDNGTLTEIDAASGKVIRRFRIGQPLSPAAMIHDNVIYFGEGEHDTHHARLYAFDLASGKLIGSFASKGHIERAAMAVKVGNEDAVVFPAGRDGVYAVSARTLKPLWRWSTGHVDTSPAVDGDTLFIGSGKERGDDTSEVYIAAVELANGRTIWAKKLSSSAFGSPVVWKDQVCFSFGDVERASEYGQIACYTKDVGEFVQAYNVDGAILGRPLIRGNELTVANIHGGITRIDLEKRKVLWTIYTPVEKRTFASIVIDENENLIFPTSKGLAVYKPGESKERYLWRPPVEKWKGAYTNVLRLKDRWIFADKGGNVFALKPKTVSVLGD
jgi:outer membrane protein assembly factor BamB